MDSSFQERLNAVRGRIEAACRRAGRDPSTVKLLAVSKMQTPEAVCEAVELGLTVFGESRVQEARQKTPLCPARLEWHFIGHLQVNKVRDAVAMFRMIHSVDSVRLLEAIDRAAGEAGSRLRVCIQINNSGEASKHGAAPEEGRAILAAAERMMNVEVAGLMTIPPFAEDPERSRGFFRALKELRDGLAASTGFGLPELSMGMSQDLEVAVEEGATLGAGRERPFRSQNPGKGGLRSL